MLSELIVSGGKLAFDYQYWHISHLRRMGVAQRPYHLSVCNFISNRIFNRWTIIMKYKKRLFCLCTAVIRSPMVIYPLFVIKTFICYQKYVLIIHINIISPKVEVFLQSILHLSFQQFSHTNITGTQGYNLCGAISSSSWNSLHHRIVKDVILIFLIIGSNHHWNLIGTPVSYQFFRPSRRGCAFSGSS